MRKQRSLTENSQISSKAWNQQKQRASKRLILSVSLSKKLNESRLSMLRTLIEFLPKAITSNCTRKTKFIFCARRWTESSANSIRKNSCACAARQLSALSESKNCTRFSMASLLLFLKTIQNFFQAAVIAKILTDC